MGRKGEDCRGVPRPALRREVPKATPRPRVASASCLPGGAGPKPAGAEAGLGEGEAEVPAVEGGEQSGGDLAEGENQPGGGSGGPWEMSSIDRRAPDTHMHGICPFYRKRMELAGWIIVSICNAYSKRYTGNPCNSPL